MGLRLRGRLLKGKEKEDPGAREARKARMGKEKELFLLPYPSRAVSRLNPLPLNFQPPVTQVIKFCDRNI